MGTPPDRPRRVTAWQLAELLFGSGAILYVITNIISGVQWGATIDAKFSRIDEKMTDQQAQILANAQRFSSLDNTALGNRITSLETQVKGFAGQQDKIEKKIDRLLERSTRVPD